MSNRNSSASVPMACLLAVGFLAIAPLANDASAGKTYRKSGESGRNYVLESNRRGRAPVIRLPIGPSYTYYDYPYYYSRGHYPTHIVHYVYYPSYYYGRGFYRGPGSLRRSRARGN
jgi:hypothetical protein